MDPNIMKFLEEDEDETMHSGADVEAFTAALNRDIEGNTSPSQQQSDSHSAALSQGSNQNTSQFFSQWQQTSGHDVIFDFQPGQDLSTMNERQHLPQSGQQHVSELENRNDETLHTSSEQTTRMQELDCESNPVRESQMGKLQNISNRPSSDMVPNDQRPMSMELKDQHSSGMVMASGSNRQHSMMGSRQQQQSSTVKFNKQVPFGMLLPIIQPQLDKDKSMQLHTLYYKLKKNETTKDEFIRNMRSIVGDHMLKMAVCKLQNLKLKNQDARNTETAAGQFQPQPQAPARQMQMPSMATVFSSSTSEVNKREEFQAASQGLQANHMSTSNSGALNQDRKHPVYTTHGFNKQQQHSSIYNYSPFSATNAQSQSMAGGHMGPTNMLNASSFDRSYSLGDPKKIQAMQQRIGVSPSSMTHVKHEPADQSIEPMHNLHMSSSHGLSSFSRGPIKQGSGGQVSLKDESFEMQSRTGFGPSTSLGPTNSISSSIPSPVETNILSHPRSITSPIGPGNTLKATPRKPLVGHKKSMEASGTSLPSSKKQKMSGGAFSDRSIEHLNDVTAVSGVNLREEEEQLFSSSKEDSRVSEASRRVVQEEEDRLILNKIPLQKKVVEIMAKCGLKNMSSDVERCLSLCVEERMRGLISNVIRLSKQRVDFEKPRHKTVITSDVRQQIMTINRKAREEWEKKQAETEKSQKPNDPESSSGVDGDKEKDESRAKSTKVNKEEDDKMRTTAANVAVRAATGVGDMLSRWQLMIEAKHKQGGPDTLSISEPGKDVTRKVLVTSKKNTMENQEYEKRDPSTATPASVRKVGRNQVVVPRVARSISVKDVIAVLEREPQMSKSTLLYRLYNKVNPDAVVD